MTAGRALRAPSVGAWDQLVGLENAAHVMHHGVVFTPHVQVERDAAVGSGERGGHPDFAVGDTPLREVREDHGQDDLLGQVVGP